MGKLVVAPFRLRDPHHVQQFDAAPAVIGPGIGRIVGPQSFPQLLPHLDNRVQRGHGILEHHGDLLSPDRAEGFRGQGQQVLPLEESPSTGYLPGGFGDESQDAQHRHRLAGSGLADYSEGFPGVEGEAHAIDGIDHLIRHIEPDREVLDG